ncbi:MAG: hypothetical protein ACI4BD_08835 [Paludibacteraceae bacterium]
MKKTILLAVLACVLVGFGSCNYYSPKEVIYESNFKTLDLRVNANDWAFSAEGGYYYCTFSVPELTSAIYDYGVVSCYREYNKGTNGAYQLPLPQTIHNVDAGDGALYTTTIDFSFSVGVVEIVLTNNDFAYNDPEGMDFRLNMVW